MLSGSTTGSPFRSNSGHRAPWPPPALHAATEGFGRYGTGGGGGLYSLFPGPGGGGGVSEASAAIYSQAATNAAARFAHSANTYHNYIGAHKVADSLFSTGYTFGGPTPPPPPAAAPPYSPVSPLVERGITQLELMAKGFNNNNNNSNTANNNINGVGSNEVALAPGKKTENKRRSECALFQQQQQQQQQGGGKRRGGWERDSHLPQAPPAPSPTPPVVKSEVSTRPSCGCRRSIVSTTSSSPSPLALRNNTGNNNGGASVDVNNTSVASFPLQQHHQQQCGERKHDMPEPSSSDRKKHDGATSLVVGSSGGGCSRTNPVSLRNGASTGSNTSPEWQPGLIQIKKEPVGSATPCLQVAEVTTSIRQNNSNTQAPSPMPPAATIIKIEANPCAPSPCNGGAVQGTNNSISSGSSVAPTNSNSGSQKPMQHPSLGNNGAIPVGIAVARQRLQEHAGCGATTKSEKPPPPPPPPAPPQPAPLQSCRQQKAPPEPPQCSPVELAPAPTTLSAMAVLQPQCEERPTNGMAPWAATTNHNPALTPPTLWQYPAPVPVQLNPTEVPLTPHPLGYQLVRDPLHGHFILLPATNIEHLQRAVLWPSYSTTAAQPSTATLQVTTQPPAGGAGAGAGTGTTQHIQLFESTPAPGSEAHEFLPTAARILVQPAQQLTLAATAAATAVTVAAPAPPAAPLQLPPPTPPQQPQPPPQPEPHQKRVTSTKQHHHQTAIAVSAAPPANPATTLIKIEPATQRNGITMCSNPLPYARFTNQSVTNYPLPRTSYPQCSCPSICQVNQISECTGGMVSSMVLDRMKPLQQAASRPMTSDVCMGTNTVPSFVATSTAAPTVQTHFFYDHSTQSQQQPQQQHQQPPQLPTSVTPSPVVQISQNPQPSASVQTENGKRSQATSPCNPEASEASITSQSEGEEATSTVTVLPGDHSSPQIRITGMPQVTVQDASNQTDTPSEDESVCETLKTQSVDTQTRQTVPECSASSMKLSCMEISSVSETKTSLEEQPAVDLSGLELLSNSIEQFESHLVHRHDKTDQRPISAPAVNVMADSSSMSSKATCSKATVTSSQKPDVTEIRPADEKAAETLQMLCHQSASAHAKSSEDRLTDREDTNTFSASDGDASISKNCDNKISNIISGQICTNNTKSSVDRSVSCGSDIPACDRDSSENKCFSVNQGEGQKFGEGVSNGLGNGSMLGGLTLLCALAEQRFMEEVATSKSTQSGSWPQSSPPPSPSASKSQAEGEAEEKQAATSCRTDHPSSQKSGSVDVNRNYKTRESERECRKFIASKGMQHYHLHGSGSTSVACNGSGGRSGSSSPQHCASSSQQHLLPGSSLCASPSTASSELMDTSEMEMRMRLAELQRKYREKQRELSKLTPKKSSSSSLSTNSMEGSPESGEVSAVVSPVKRGPGRPRKRCNRLCLDLPPNSPSNSKPRVGRPPLLKNRDSASHELPPPVLEKVTELSVNTRQRFDADEDCAAPKLKALKPDILKPPTLTANRIYGSTKYKPAVTNNNTVDSKSLKLLKCNVNLVKLEEHNGGISKLKETTKSGDSGLRKSSSSLLSPSDITGGEKHRSALSLSNSAPTGHTFGWKPPAHHTPLPGESDSLFWSKGSITKTVGATKSQQQEFALEMAEEHNAKLSPSPPPLSPSLPPCHSSSSSCSSSSAPKKRKVGRPKKNMSALGCVIATEMMMIAKKPKSKSSLVGLLLSSKSRHHNKPSSLLEGKSSPSSDSSVSQLRSTCSSQKLGEGTVSSDSTKTSANVQNSFTKSTGDGGTNNILQKSGAVGPTSASDRKPNKIRPKLKAEAKVKPWSWCEDEDTVPVIDWSGSKTKAATPPPTTHNQTAWSKKALDSKVEKTSAKGPSVSAPVVTSDGAARGKKRKLNSTEAKAAQAPLKAGVKKTLTKPGSKKEKKCVQEPVPAKKQKRSNPSLGQGTTGSESDDVPLSVLSKQQCLPAPSSPSQLCQLTQAHLNVDKQRALTAMSGQLYAGTISAIRAPDVYGITLDGERGNRPHILSREEILKEAFLEVKPMSIRALTPGTRVCAYWSGQYRCLYPGTVAQPSSPDPELDDHFVNVEFDDGDSGRINIDDIRLLPSDYPIPEYDPNPLLSLGKRRRRNSAASSESHSKDRKANSEEAVTSTINKSSSTLKDTSSAQKVVLTKALTSPTNKVEDVTTESMNKPVQQSEVLDHMGSTKTSIKVSVTNGTTAIGALEDREGAVKTELSDRSSSSSSGRERKRLKKRRREKLKRLLAEGGSVSAILKKRRKKHRCSSEEHCRHKRHHKRHRKHRHRSHNGNRNKDSGSGSSSAESSSKQGIRMAADVLSKQMNILEIQQTAIRQVASQQQQQQQQQQPPQTLANASTVESSISQDLLQSGVNTETGKGEDATPEESESEEEQPEESVDSSTPEPQKNVDVKKNKKEKEAGKPKKGRDRQPSVESRSKMAAFLPARQLWGWSGRGFKRPGAKGRGKKEFFKAIQRGKETIRVGDCAVFLSTGRPDRPYIGRIESMWESWGTNMVVKVKWFYHPEETNGCPAQLQYPGALFESPHVDENDVQTISHKCEVLPLEGYTKRLGSEPQRYSTVYDNNDIYYLAGYYDPTTSQLTLEPGVV